MKWTTKKIAFIAILIATSIAFVVIGANLAALSSIPSIKLSIAGLPVKISGYLFGPIVGFVIGFTTDVLTFLFVPTFYYPLYSIALGVSGLVPGLFSFIYIKLINPLITNEGRIKRIQKKEESLQKEYNLSLLQNGPNSEDTISLSKKLEELKRTIFNLNNSKKNKTTLNFSLFSGLFLISLIFAISMLFIFGVNQSALDEQFKPESFLSFLSNKNTFYFFLIISFVAYYAFLIITRFTFSEKNFLKMVPILMFIMFTEYINLPIVAVADQESLGVTFFASFIGSFATSPIKIWFNLLIITFAIRIVEPLIKNKEKNSY